MKRILSVFVKSKEAQPTPSPPTQEERILQLLPLAKSLYRFSPIIAFDDYSRAEPCGGRVKGISKRLHELSDPWSYGVNLDLSGTGMLFEDERELLRKISEAISFQGFLSRMAMTPSLGMSWGLSRFSGARVNLISQVAVRDAAEQLPIVAFRLSEKELQALAELEVKTGRELLRMPRSSLLERFGAGILQRIDQMLGLVDEVLPKCRINFPVSVCREFDVPLGDCRAVAHQAERLLQEFLEKVQSSHLRVSAFRVDMLSESRQPFQKLLRLSAPVSRGESAFVWKLLTPYFENLAFPDGIREIRFSSEHAEPQQRLQLPSAEQGRESFAKLLDVLSEHLGAEEVQQLACSPSHLPERAFSYVPRGSLALKDSVAPQHSEERPSVLFCVPSPVRVIAPLPDGPPAWLEWREQRYRIASAIGPERISPPWWGEDEERFQTKDYFRVQVPSGSWLWIYREQTKWFVHGIWT